MALNPLCQLNLRSLLKESKMYPQKTLIRPLHVRIEDLIQLDEDCWHDENINHIHLLRKENWDEKGKLKNIYEVI